MATLKDIARECGVTTATVSMTINGKGRIAPETRNRIMEAVRRLNYHTNNNITPSQPVSTNTVGLVMPGVHTWTGGFYHRAVDAAMTVAPTFGHDCKILSAADLQQRVIDSFHRGRTQLGCDSLIFFCPTGDWQRYLPGLSAWQVPLAVIRRHLDMPGVTCITDDDYKGFRMAVEHLADLGHKTIILLQSFAGGDISDRARAYRDVVRERGLTADDRLIMAIREAEEPMVQRIARLKKEGIDATAIMCSGDHLAVEIAQGMLRAGLRIPEDVSVMGYDDDPLCTGFYPNISSVRIHVEDMMTAAFRAVVDPAPETAGAQQTITFGNELVVRESTGPVHT